MPVSETASGRGWSDAARTISSIPGCGGTATVRLPGRRQDITGVRLRRGHSNKVARRNRSTQPERFKPPRRQPSLATMVSIIIRNMKVDRVKISIPCSKNEYRREFWAPAGIPFRPSHAAPPAPQQSGNRRPLPSLGRPRSRRRFADRRMDPSRRIARKFFTASARHSARKCARIVRSLGPMAT